MSAAPLSKPAGAAESPARTSSAPASSAPTSLALVGAGVRGTQLLLQLSRTLRADGDTLDLHVIDPFPFGAGRTWRTDQSDALLMNGPTESVSAFRLGEGPDLVTWLDAQAPDRQPVDEGAADRTGLAAQTDRPGPRPAFRKSARPRPDYRAPTGRSAVAGPR